MAAPQDRKKYTRMENVLQVINKNFITVNDKDRNQAVPVLQDVVEQLIDRMKNQSALFTLLFTDILYGGSFFDNLKVGKPDEFDLDLRLELPKLVDAQLETANRPGFAHLRLKGWDSFAKNKTEYERFRGLENLKDSSNYLSTAEVFKFVKKVVCQALATFPSLGRDKYLIPCKSGGDMKIAKSESGPAFTLLIDYKNISMSVDLVATIRMRRDKWPQSFKSCPTVCNNKGEFMLVPKAPKPNTGIETTVERYWRLSFQEQEKVLISGKNNCKTSLRLLKKLRDTQNHSLISSYFLKTVFLHAIDEQPNDFWSAPLSYVFMQMLKKYRDYLNQSKIPYYWNTKYNLLQMIPRITINNFKGFLDRAINEIDKKVDTDPIIISNYILNPAERQILKNINSEPLIENEPIKNDSLCAIL